MTEFTQHFDTYALADERIETTWGPYRVTATILYDDAKISDDDGFWPEKPNPLPPAGSTARRRYYRELASAREIEKAWKNDEWFYCGIMVRVLDEDDETLGSDSCWGIECNYPHTAKVRDPKTGRWTKGRANSYLRDVANECLGEALKEAERNIMARENRLLGRFGLWEVYDVAGGPYAVSNRGNGAGYVFVWFTNDPDFAQLPAETQEGLLNIVKLFGGDSLREEL